MTTARIQRLHAAARDDIGDLITRRPLPSPGLPHLDPFLFLNHHGPQVYPTDNQGLPFGPHPHRGFETVTFILEGELAHFDSGDHASVIRAGGVQWMTAGSGLVHAEVSPEAFRKQGGPLEILQLWVNLPASLKMTPPAYTGLQREQIPRIELDTGRVALNLVAGDYEGHQGPVRSLTGMFMSWLEFSNGGQLRLSLPHGRTPFVYVVRGELTISGEGVSAFQLAELSQEGGEVLIEARQDSVLLFGHGQPLQEPIVSYGPFVMNTREEISQAIQDYNAGKFGGLKLDGGNQR